MAIVVMVLGESGTGKTASLRNLNPDQTLLVNVMDKPLPFRGKFDQLKTDNFASISNQIVQTDKPTIVIDDAQYIMANEFMNRANERGFDKFTEIGQHFWSLINTAIKCDDNKVIYFLMHTEQGDNGTEKAKTIGRMLDEKITLEGMFTIVLTTVVNDGEYFFATQNNGRNTVKTPMGMFDSVLIPNDLALVNKAIREYYELGTESVQPTAPTLKKQPPKNKKPKQATPQTPDVLDVPDLEYKENDPDPFHNSKPKQEDKSDYPLADNEMIEVLLDGEKLNVEQYMAWAEQKGVVSKGTKLQDYPTPFLKWSISNIESVVKAIRNK